MFNNQFYKENPLHVYSYEEKNGHYVVSIINLNLGHVEEVTFAQGKENITIKVDTNSDNFNVEFDVSDIYFVEKPTICNAVIDGKKIDFTYIDCEYIIQPKSIFSMRRERFLYVQKMVKQNGLKKENITCEAVRFDSYWHCTCGHINFNCQDKCMNCHEEKRKIFNNEVFVDKEQGESNYFINLNMAVLPFIVLTLILNFFIVNVLYKGDVLYSNTAYNDFLGVMDRFVLPLLPVVGIIVSIIGRNKYSKLIEYIGKGIKVASLVTLNVISLSLFVRTSYNFVIVFAYDIIFAVYYALLLKVKVKNIPAWAMLLLLTSTPISNIAMISYYSQYEMSINTSGVNLVINVNEENYHVPKYIGGIPVGQITFKNGYDYSKIKTLNIPSTVHTVSIPTPTLIPNLTKINLEDGNKNLYVHNEVLFYTSTKNKIALVPAQLKEIKVDWEEVYDYSFRGCTNLEKVVITDSVKSINQYAFEYNYSLKEIDFSDATNLKSIGDYAFRYNLSLTSVEIPDSLTYLGISPFEYCDNMKRIKAPFVGMKRYTNNDSSNQNLFTRFFGAGYRYSQAGLKSTSSAGGPTIALDEVIITNQALIQNVTFYQANVKKIVLNEMNSSFGNQVFAESSIEEMVIPNGITEIGTRCFEECENLKTITIPSTVRIIKQDAFKGCSSLTSVVYEGDKSSLVIESGNEIIVSLL